MARGQRPLAGRRVLVTRPAHQSGAVCALIEAAGGRALRLPLIAIDWITPQPPSFPTADRVIFTSANAVEGLERVWGPLAPALGARGAPRVVAIGPATRRRLRAAGVEVAVSPPSAFTSEALLETLGADSLRGRRVWIVKGSGGRRLLQEALEHAGARVATIPVYRRKRLRRFPEAVARALRGGAVDAALATSGEILTALDDYLAAVEPAARDRLVLVAGGSRVADLAREAGFRRVVQARDPSDAAMVEALVGHFTRGGD
jgi:uroporphyrinogen-III synthase